MLIIQRTERTLANHLFGLLVAIILALPANAQEVPPTLAAALQTKLTEQRNSLNIKGVSAAVMLPNGGIWEGKAGVSSQFPLDSIETNYVFGLGSITKTITAACVLQMADQGLVHLDSSLFKYIQPITHVSAAITLRQLLRHESGVFDFVYHPSFSQNMNQAPNVTWTMAETMAAYLQPADFEPGTQWAYSNSNYVLLGMVIEAVTGLPYHEAIRQRLLEPNDLDALTYRTVEVPPSPIAHVWIDLNGNGVVDDAHNVFSNWKSYHSTTGPAGSYYANARTTARWLHRLMATDSILTPSMLTQAKVTVPSSLPAGTRYGLGLMERTFSGLKAFGHGGDSGYSGIAWYFPDSDLTVVILNNDNSRTSWQLSPIMTALLGTYNAWLSVPTDDVPSVPEASIQVAPNPFSTGIRVNPGDNATESITWTLHNALGQTVRTGTWAVAAPQHTIEDLQGLPNGSYTFSMRTATRTLGARHLIKQ
jgi:D-alanyl-D-alanine carboxypeptidase